MSFMGEKEYCLKMALLYGDKNDDALKSAIDEAWELMESLVNISLAKHHRVAILSLAVDVVRGKIDGDLEGSQLITLLNNGQLQLAAAEFQNWCHRDNKIVVPMYIKRMEEAKLFLGLA